MVAFLFPNHHHLFTVKWEAMWAYRCVWTSYPKLGMQFGCRMKWHCIELTQLEWNRNGNAMQWSWIRNGIGIWWRKSYPRIWMQNLQNKLGGNRGGPDLLTENWFTPSFQIPNLPRNFSPEFGVDTPEFGVDTPSFGRNSGYSQNWGYLPQNLG